MEHLKPDQIDAFRGRTLSAGALLDASRHLKQCPECRASLVARGSAAQMPALLAATGNPHLSYEELEGYVDRRLSAGARGRVVTHLELCADCRNEADDLGRFRQEFQPPRRRQLKRWPVAIGIAAALVVIGILVKQQAPPDQYAGLVDRTLAAGRMDVPAGVMALRGSGSLLRGEGGATFQLKSPLATAVLSAQPEFAWSAAAPSARYTISIYDESHQRADQSAPIEETHWTPLKPLVTGRVYEWQVRAQTGDTTLIAPGAGGPAARFLIVDAAEVKRLTEASLKFPEDRLLLGILYAQAGALDEAEGHLAEAGTKGLALLTFVRSLRQ